MVRLIAALCLALPAFADEDALAKAAEALQADDYAAAAPLLEEALQADPENVEARFNLAFAYAQLGRDDEAIAAYRETLAAKPGLPQALMNLSMLLLRGGRAEEAVAALEELAAARPEDYQTHYYLARALNDAGRKEQAVEAYAAALALKPDAADARLERAELLLSLKRYDEAEDEYARAAELDPTLPASAPRLGAALEAEGRREQALAVYEKHLATHPDDGAIAERAGLLAIDLDRPEQAVERLEPLLGDNPSSVVRAALAEAYARLDRTAEAFPLWDASLKADPGRLDVRLRYAEALLKAAEFERSAEQYYAATKLDDQSLPAWTGLAFALYKLENYPVALKAFHAARARGELKPAALFVLAIVQDQLQLYEEAKASYESFLAADPPLEDEVWKSRQRLKVIEKVLSRK